ncbi:hypothetical protein AAFC00_003964 [Neodothiora populina]|uniref:Zn(2)-C6 fungal-type domain-containing protein n=1 Tax=Neodothiora populina TaxID=2781224 RepID=A0ABR3PI31_9PEZI
MTTEQHVKRKRSRIACEPCRERKRKCNGENPCDTCSQFDYQCYFDSHMRKKRTTGLALSNFDDYQTDTSPPNRAPDQTAPSTGAPSTTSAAATAAAAAVAASGTSTTSHNANAQSHLRSMEANSGAAFMRKLALKMDPVNAPKLSLFAWNLHVGGRGEFQQTPRSVADILTRQEMYALTNIYFEKIHAVYGFLNRALLYDSIEATWQARQAREQQQQQNLSPQQASQQLQKPPGPQTKTKKPRTDPEELPREALLCGVAALASLFTHPKAEQSELELAKRAHTLLEKLISSLAPTFTIMSGWMLRVVYLRMTAPPHIVWMASCAVMHMIEAAGLHTEPSPDAILPRAPNEADPEDRRRLFGVAQHLNIWISFDMGRSRVALRGISSLPPSPRPSDVTTQVLDFLPLSESLDPDKNPDSSELETVLASVLETTPTHPASTLTQCNLMLCIYRRLRVLNHNISGTLLDRVVTFCTRGIHAARELLDTVCPWHHIAYSPFQIICTLLAIDTRAALTQLEPAMETLAAVAATYDTPSMKEAYSTARLLVLLHQKRKEEDSRILTTALNVGWQPQPPSESTPSSNIQHNNVAATYSWLDDLTVDMPNMQDFDWNTFLTDDASWYMNMPNANMPNGNMANGNMPTSNMQNTSMAHANMSHQNMSPNQNMSPQNVSPNHNMPNHNMQTQNMSNHIMNLSHQSMPNAMSHQGTPTPSLSHQSMPTPNMSHQTMNIPNMTHPVMAQNMPRA